jgi:[acyl-carrier-protein] S-malonyltransferase
MLVFMFPGQSSRYPAMLEKLCALRPRSRELLGLASDLLRRDLAAHYRADNPTIFGRNRDVQIGVFLANQMFLAILEDAGIEAGLSLGLSLGEYNHLCHIGALGFEQALLTVEQRGLAYDAGPRGAMASVFPIELEELEAVARRASASAGAVLEVVNLNSPRQHVLSGAQAALEQALRILEEEHYVEARVIERQVPMHSSLFEPVGSSFRAHLETVSFAAPRLPYLPNRLGEILPEPSPAAFVDLLATHVHRPVLWRRSIDFVAERWPDAVFVEVGPLAVLYNLLDKKWHKNRKHHADSAEATDEHLPKLVEELAAVARGGSGEAAPAQSEGSRA